MNTETLAGVAQAILDGFNRHYQLFREYSREGKQCFEHADWARAAQVSRERIQGYERRVRESRATQRYLAADQDRVYRQADESPSSRMCRNILQFSRL
jgi:isocitrate dehydrogenase kinase/phosphatase